MAPPPVLTESGTMVGSSALPGIRVCRPGSAQATRSQPWIAMKRASLRARPDEDEQDAAHAPPPPAFHANGAPSQPFASRARSNDPRVCPGGYTGPSCAPLRLTLAVAPQRAGSSHGLPGQTLPEYRSIRSYPIRGLLCEPLQSQSRVSTQSVRKSPLTKPIPDESSRPRNSVETLLDRASRE